MYDDILKWNQRQLNVQGVHMHGYKPTTIRFEPYEMGRDNDGVVRFLAIRLQEGDVCECALLPNYQRLHELSEFTHHWLVRFGISVAGSKLLYGRTPIQSVLRFVATTVAQDVLADFLRDVDVNFSSYYEIRTHEQVIDRPIVFQVPRGGSPDWR